MELDSIGLYQSSGKEKENCCFVSPSSKKREIRHYHVVVVQRRLRNVNKSVMHVQSKTIGFLPFSLKSLLSLLKLPEKIGGGSWGGRTQALNPLRFSTHI